MSSHTVLFDAPGPRGKAVSTALGIVGLLIVIGIGAAIVWGLRNEFLDPTKWEPLADPITWTAYLLPGLLATLQAAVVAVILSGILGIGLGIGRLSHSRVVSGFCTAFIEFFRAVPVLMMMLFAYYVFLFGKVLAGDALSFWSVVVGLTLYNSSVIAELIRSGVHSLPQGQREAGLAIGLTPGQTLKAILVPQAITAMLPALVSQLVVVLKDTALGYMVTYPELVRAAQNLATVKGNLLVAFLAVALIFIVVNLGLTSLAHLVERKVARRTSGKTIVKMQMGVEDATETA